MRNYYLLTGLLLVMYHQGMPQHGEVYASRYKQQPQASRYVESYSLKQGLRKLEKIFKVSIAYKDEWVKNKVVQESVDFMSVEKALEVLLQGTDLYYEKAGERFYVIHQRKDSTVSASGPRDLLMPLPSLTNSIRQFPVSFPSVIQRVTNHATGQQVIAISGRVTDEGGATFPGVNIIIKGTSIGTVTDVDGKYSLEVGDENAVLIFSFVGYAQQEVPVNGKTVIDVIMVPDITALEEVVVTALGIQKSEKKLGYSATVVKSEDISVNRTSNFMNALQGKVAGLNVTSLGTGPAGTSKIRLRGQSSVGGQNNPLIVLNGVPIESNNYGINPNTTSPDGSIQNRGTFNKSDGGDGLISINPDDIETMTVLKGGTAAALYGSRAKDGVIMITTKSKGTGKGIGVEWNSNYMVSTPLDFTDFQYEYGQGENGTRPTAPNPESGVWSFGEKFQPGMTQTLFDGVVVPYAPVRNRIRKFYRNGSNWTNTVSLSSGGERGGFNLSFSNMNTTSIVPNSDFERKTINLGFTQDISSKLKVTGNINYSHEDNNNPPVVGDQDLSTPTTLYTMSNSMPLYLLKAKRLNEAGNEYRWSRFTNRTNPYFSVYDRFDHIRRDRLFGNITARYSLTDWLFVQGRLGQDFYTRDQEYNFPTGIASGAAAQPGFVNGQFVQDARRYREINADFLVGANRKFGDFGIDFTAGGNQMYRKSDLNSVLVQEFVVRGLYTVQNGRVKDPRYTPLEWRINSLYAASEFSYKDFLFLNGTIRFDWFSTLSPAKRRISYPSVTGSFVFSQAFENLPAWITFGKVRAAYAEVGSDQDILPYSNYSFYGVNANFLPGPDGTSQQPIGTILGTSIPNPGLQPMRVLETEFGLALKMFQDRVSFDVAYYIKTTRDQILNTQVSDATGYVSRLINVGKSRNKGVELLVGVTPFESADFKWDVNLNGAYNTSEVLSLGTASTTGSVTVATGLYDGELRQVVGKPLGQLYGYGYLRDEQGRRVFNATSGVPLRSTAMMNFGSGIPKWVGGISNNFNYKGILFSFLIDFKLGHKMISLTNYNAWRHGLHKGTLAGREEGYVVGEGVKPDGDINDVQAAVQPFYSEVRSSHIVEEFVYDAGFWKLRQVTLGYDFTRFLPKDLFIKSIRLSAVANNVLMLKKWVPNIDPEQFAFSSDNLVGLEATGIPTTRNIGFNLNVKF